MRILITGGAGFIGSNLVLTLQHKKHEIVVIDNFLSSSLENLAGFNGEFIKADISTLDLTTSFKDKKFDVIFHQAAITDTTLDNDETMLKKNVVGFKNVLDLAKTMKAKLVYASSAAVYGRDRIPMRENHELVPLNSYGISKKMIDELTKEEMKKDEIVIVGLRYFNVYGLKEKHKNKSASMIYQLYLQMKAGIRPRIFKWGKQFRDFVYVKDVVNANFNAMFCEKSCIVNIGTGVATTFNRIIELLNNALNTGYEPEYFDNPYEFYQNETLADTKLAYELLGFKVNFFIEQGIKEYISLLEQTK